MLLPEIEWTCQVYGLQVWHIHGLWRWPSCLRVQQLSDIYYTCTGKWLQIQTCILYTLFSFSISHIDIKEKCRLNRIFLNFMISDLLKRASASLRAVWKLVEKYSCLICNLQGLFFSLHWMTGVYKTCWYCECTRVI